MTRSMKDNYGFWEFSIATYQSDGVADACLALQNQHGADVNMLLYCCWVAKVAGEFTDDLFSTAMQFATEWGSNVVWPLRSVRQWMKHTEHSGRSVLSETHEGLRFDIKGIELRAEKLQQTVLESFVIVADGQHASDPEQLAHAAANLRRYCRIKEIETIGESVDQLSVILSGAITSATPQSALEALS